MPECPYCGATEGLRIKCDGFGIEAPEFTCEGCFTPADDGPCFDDLPIAPAIPVAFASLGVRWDGIEHFRIRFSDGHIEERSHHISYRAPYYHFGHSETLTNPPLYDAGLGTPKH
jgi:hypothetical protein